MIFTTRSFGILPCKLSTLILGLPVLFITIALYQSSAYANEPGLPFTEEFIDADLRAVGTTANWDTLDQFVKLGKRSPKKLGLTADTSTGMDVSSNLYSTFAVKLADINGDGTNDIITGNYVYIRDPDTFDSYASIIHLSDATNTIRSIDTGDIDQDGDLDIVFGAQGINLLYFNNGTDTPFEGVSKTYITSDNDYTVSIQAIDVNGDGWLDVVVGNEYTNDRLYINNGTSNPFDGVTAQTFGEPSSARTNAVMVADIDYDGNNDIVSVYNNGQTGTNVKYILNNGSSTEPFLGQTSKDISNITNGELQNIDLGDVNGDKYIDIVVSGEIDSGVPSYLFINNSANTPGTPFDTSTSAISISSDTDRSVGIHLLDADDDGDLDVYVANYSARGKLYVNDGSNEPFGASLEGIDISNDSIVAHSSGIGDIDNDGDIDIVVGANGIDRLYLNNSSSSAFDGIADDISTDADQSRGLAYGDVDNDGDIDIITSGLSTQAKLYKNNGTNKPFDGVSATIITDAHSGAYLVYLADINHDGRLDLINGGASGQLSEIFFNNGSSTPYTAANMQTFGVSTFVLDIATGDVNNDGKTDLIQGTRLYLNDGTSTPFSSGGIDIDSGGFDKALGDVDNDGDLDLVEATLSGAWLYLNDGDSTPYSNGKIEIGTGLQSNSIELYDLNQDGYLDAIIGSFDDYTRVVLNDGTSTPFDGNAMYLGTNTASTDIKLGDFNLDGIIDIASVNEDGKRVEVLYPDVSDYTFVNSWRVPTNFASDEAISGYKLAVADFSNDGKPDIVVAANGINRIYYNQSASAGYSSITRSQVASSTGAYRSLDVTAADFNNDGALDVAFANYDTSTYPNTVVLNNKTSSPFGGSYPATIPYTLQYLDTDKHSSWGIDSGDITGDGYPDIVVANTSAASRVYTNDGTGLFGSTSGYNLGSGTTARDVKLADLNGDGRLDAVLANYSTTLDNQIFLNNGSSYALSVTPISVYTGDAHYSMTVELADIDNDDDIDIMVGNNGSNYTYLNNGTGTSFYKWEFYSGAPGTDTQNSYGIAIGDVNGDGWPDAVVGNYGTVNKLYINDTLSNPFTNAGIDITTDADYTLDILLEDIDNDGDLDVIVFNASGVNKYYLNNGTATPFSDAVGIELTTSSKTSYGAVARDFDNDGVKDFVVANYTLSNDLFRSSPYALNKNKVISEEVDTDTDILKATLNGYVPLDWNNSVDFYMSNNGGTQFFQVQRGVEFTFPTQGDDLRWKAELHSLTPLRSPLIGDVVIDAKVDHDLDFATDDIDLCIGTADPDQLDNDSDAVPGVSTGPDDGGDACDIDDDNDGVGDTEDLFPFNSAEQGDYDGDCGAIDYNLPTSGDGCGDNSDTDIDNDGIPNVSDTFMFNVAPTISGTPGTVATPENTYTFTPAISDGGDGPTLSVSVTADGGSLPAWLTFNPATGVLTGVPSNDNYGTISNIVLTVSDGTEQVSLPAFNIKVIDTRAPVTNASPKEGVYNSDISVYLSCSDGIGSECANIYYSTDGGMQYNLALDYAIIDIPASSHETILKYYSVDNADTPNYEVEQTQVYTFDNGLPVVTITSPVADSILTSVNSINGSSSDNADFDTGIKKIELQITDGINSVQVTGGSL
ncbi:MAG: FG-GAP-like repeat-containing protein, partial [Gammaproteobacteria bacterium]|nr:FG-GAP-like repeat-containing protein [Gammaproteobacteria bacterium]